MSYDTALGKQCLEWIRDVTQDKSFSTDGSGDNLQAVLKDGIVLCKLMNALRPGSIPDKRLQKAPKLNFQQMELIAAFLEKLPEYGIPDHEKFQTIDLYEKQNLRQVLICFQSMARKAKSEGKPGFL